LKTKNKFSDRFRYAVDNTFSKGTSALIGWLGILSLIVITIAALLVIATGAHLEGEESISFIEAFWRSLMRTLDAGTMGGDTGWDFRLIMFLVTIGGVFIISTLIGVLTAGVEGKLEELRKGRSKVIEEGQPLYSVGVPRSSPLSANWSQPMRTNRVPALSSWEITTR
jgi:ion channel POLLUX/CASTOR